jgi:signal transduction histidine kinase
MQYSAGVKGLVILFEELFSVILVVCIVMLTALLERSMLNFNDLRSKPFSESGYYEGLFKNAALEVMNYVRLKEQFETRGTYDPDKIIDIRDFTSTGNVMDDNGMNILSMSEAHNIYHLKDLESWSQSYKTLVGMVESNLSLENNKVIRQHQTVTIAGKVVKDAEVTVKSLSEMSESIQKVIIEKVQRHYGGNYELGIFQNKRSANTNEINEEVSAPGADQKDDNKLSQEDQQLLNDAINKSVEGKLYELESKALWLLLDSLDLKNVDGKEETVIIQEDYLPISDKSVLDVFLSEDISWKELQEAHNNLSYALENIENELDAYRQLVSRYQREDTNLKFWYFSDYLEVPFTNISAEEPESDLLSFGKKQGSYFYYNEASIQMATNMYGMEEFYFESMDEISNDQNRTLLISLNTSFSNKDSFFEAKTEYNNLQPWVMVSLVAALFSLFGSLLCFIYLSISAGRNTKDEEIHLCWFDRIKTEIMLLAFGGGCIGTFYLYKGSASLFDNEEITGLMIMSGGITFSVMGIFLIFYLSIVRRYKASVMWSGSCIYWIGKELLNIFHNRKLLTKLIILFGIHSIICILLGLLLYFGMAHLWILIVSFSLFLLISGAECIYLVREMIQRNNIIDGVKKIAAGNLEYEIDTTQLIGENKSLGSAINTIGEGLYLAVDGSMKNERLKTDLITNVSHDIKTPLTSIINYVDLIKREDIKNERVQGFIRILDEKSQRLKHLTEDLVEASKVSSGNITLQMEHIDLVELVYQTGGEFDEKFEARGLTMITELPNKPVVILADGRRIWRVIENLYNNAAKYAMVNTRVYIGMDVEQDTASFSIKNISEQPLNIDASELTERFIRGDVSRSTEGSGLGLSIASDLTQLMGGSFDIYLDGDLFKVTISFPLGKR